MNVLHDETTDLLNALRFTLGVMLNSDDQAIQRIANAYGEAQSLVATMALDDEGSARPRILACFDRFNAYKVVDDVAANGWLLAALQERVNERNLYGWRKLKKLVDGVVNRLPPPKKPVFH